MGAYSDWSRCCSCGQRARIRKKLWLRAARPRCGACGGPLEQSETDSLSEAQMREVPTGHSHGLGGTFKTAEAVRAGLPT